MITNWSMNSKLRKPTTVKKRNDNAINFNKLA